MVNINVQNIKLMAKKISWGKKHVCAAFLTCLHCTIRHLRFVQLLVLYLINSIPFACDDQFFAGNFSLFFFVNVNIYGNIIYEYNKI